MQKSESSNENTSKNEPNSELLDKLHNTGVFGRSEYAKKDFWNDRFKESNGFFDWYLDWEDLKPYLEKTYPIKKDSRILMVGCGNASKIKQTFLNLELSEKMYKDGYQNIINIDISDVVIEKMKIYHEEKNMKMEFLVMDATEMTFENDTFDVIIDKGTLDAIMCGKISEPTQKLLTEMTRVLKKDGEIFIISHGQPNHRKELFVATLGSEKYKFMFSKQELSSLAQLINIFRSKLKDKPISHILKDKDLLEESIREYKEHQQLSILKRLLLKKKELDEAKKKAALQEENENTAHIQQKVNEAPLIVEKNSTVVTKTDEKIITQTESIEEQKTNFTTQQTDSLAIENMAQTVENKKNDKHMESQKILSEENAKVSESKSKNTEETDIKAEYNPQRQSHCFIYYIKKL